MLQRTALSKFTLSLHKNIRKLRLEIISTVKNKQAAATASKQKSKQQKQKK